MNCGRNLDEIRMEIRDGGLGIWSEMAAVFGSGVSMGGGVFEEVEIENSGREALMCCEDGRCEREAARFCEDNEMIGDFVW